MALLVVAVTGFATFGRASGGVWVVGLVLFWPLAAFVLSAIVPPIYERGYTQPHVTFVSILLAVFASVFTVEFVIMLFLHTILGAKPWETSEQLGMLSAPLAFFSRQFLITPETNFVDACGVMLGNSFLIAIPVFVCAKVVPSMLRRNRTTQIGISSSGDQDDD